MVVGADNTGSHTPSRVGAAIIQVTCLYCIEALLTTQAKLNYRNISRSTHSNKQASKSSKSRRDSSCKQVNNKKEAVEVAVGAPAQAQPQEEDARGNNRPRGEDPPGAAAALQANDREDTTNNDTITANSSLNPQSFDLYRMELTEEEIVWA